MTAREQAELRDRVARARLTVAAETGTRSGCAGCGCELAGRTFACKTCSNRHGRRAKRTNLVVLEREREQRRDRHWRRTGRVQARRLDECAGCGCDLDEKTPGCAPCSNRHYARRQRRAA